jgi:hypothetical protein
MTVETVNFISDLDKNNPSGSDSISQGDDHIRNIKKAITNTFPNVKGAVTVTHEELNSLGDVLGRQSGVFASVKYNGSSVMYSQNVSSVTPTGNGIGTRVTFSQPTAGFDHHYVVLIQPYATNNRHVICTVTDQRDTYVEFTTLEFDGANWGSPIAPIGFSMVMIDMIQMADNS